MLRKNHSDLGYILSVCVQTSSSPAPTQSRPHDIIILSTSTSSSSSLLVIIIIIIYYALSETLGHTRRRARSSNHRRPIGFPALSRRAARRQPARAVVPKTRPMVWCAFRARPPNDQSKCICRSSRLKHFRTYSNVYSEIYRSLWKTARFWP